MHLPGDAPSPFDDYKRRLEENGEHERAVELEQLRGICTLERSNPKPRLKRSTISMADLKTALPPKGF